ncbi:aquaporin [Myceligenerans crystallogenes]|uniref:Aquaporin Z n=1 Tax=Myceligenerans crystallogenes TaxID=316335 RepID=A0ABN2N4D4_9MICO
MANAYAVPDGALDAPAESTGSGTLNRVLAEAFGTFVLVLGVLSVGVYSFLNQSGAVGVALTAGLAYAAALVAVGHVSGGWFNPVITLAQAIAGRVRWTEVPLYFAGQLVGGFAAGAVVRSTIPGDLPKLLSKADGQALFVDASNGWGDHSPLYTLSQGGASFSWWQAGIVEVVATAALAGLALAASATRNRGIMAAAGGLGLAGLTVVTYAATGTGLNPVRSTVAALFANNWSQTETAGADGAPQLLDPVSPQLWLFWVAPLIGAAIAALFAVAFGSATAEPVADATVDVDDDDDDDDELVTDKPSDDAAEDDKTDADPAAATVKAAD